MKPAHVVIIAILTAAISFFAGMKYSESQQSQLRSTMMGQFQGRFGNGQTQGRNEGASGKTRQGFRPVMGEIIKQDDKSITVKLPDNSSKIVILSEITSYTKSDTAKASDIKIGDQVGVFGTENTDGSVTAQNIQLNPQFGGFRNIISPQLTN